MQSGDLHDNVSPAEAVSTKNGHGDTPLNSTNPFVPPRIPLGLPHVVHFVESSLYHMPNTIRNIGSMMARYADRDGVVSIARLYLCEITGIGSHHTVSHAIDVMESMQVLEKYPGKGGKDRKSNTYRFLGKERDWRHLPTEKPGKDPYISLSESRLENEGLTAENAGLKAENQELLGRIALLTNGHSGVTVGNGQTAPDSYESVDSPGEHGAIGHSEVTDGEGNPGPETASHSHENEDSNGSEGESEAIGHSEVTDGSDEGQEYLSRRARVQELVMNHRDYYQQSFNRRGVLGAIEFFSRSAENEQDLIRQAGILEAGGDPRHTRDDPPPETEAPPQTTEDSDRYAVGECPDCGRPFATHGGAEYCTDCTERRRRESEA